MNAFQNSEALLLDVREHGDLIHQLFHVFRYEPGQEVILLDGSGKEYVVEISEISKKSVRFVLKNKKAGLVQNEALKNKVILCFSLIKKDNIELILQKCTELGVTEFYPLISERSEKKGFNHERGEKILIEAIEQSGWSTVPLLHEVQSLEEVIQKTKNPDVKQIAFHCSSSLSPSSERREREETSSALFVGPEGGWSDEEIELFKKNNVEFQSLGKSVLRAETAAIAAVAKQI